MNISMFRNKFVTVQRAECQLVTVLAIFDILR